MSRGPLDHSQGSPDACEISLWLVTFLFTLAAHSGVVADEQVHELGRGEEFSNMGPGVSQGVSGKFQEGRGILGGALDFWGLHGAILQCFREVLQSLKNHQF